MSTTAILNLAEELRVIADEISYNAIDTSTDYPKRGTIVKALASQTRFKPKSMWVSLGNGTYKHLTGSKGLVTTHDRLDGYTEVVFEA
ncbi:MAG: hypothetical protein EBU08_15680 [Micrococcales bacterium]|nr:hypothetical protein [Micrococcales bacterium]